MDIQFEYNADKNATLIKERGIGFDAIIYHISNGHLLATVAHHNKEKYANQYFYVVDVEGYVYLVPFVEKDENTIFLKTIFASRKHTKQYLKQKANRGGKGHE